MSNTETPTVTIELSAPDALNLAYLIETALPHGDLHGKLSREELDGLQDALTVIHGATREFVDA